MAAIAGQSQITEATILSSYLLNPSPLTTVLPYNQFLTLCVPAQYRLHPLVKRLYRDLQFQRSIDVDNVRENILRECAKSGVLKARLAGSIAAESGLKRKRTTSNSQRRTDRDHSVDADDLDLERDQQIDSVMLEATVHPAAHVHESQTASTMPGSTHTPLSLVQTLESSIDMVKSEIEDLDALAKSLISGMEEMVGQLSDLRYGRFTRPSGGLETDTVEDDIVNSLKQLEAAAREATKSDGSR